MTRRTVFDPGRSDHLFAGWKYEKARVPLLLAMGRHAEAQDAQAAADNHWRRLQEITGGQET